MKYKLSAFADESSNAFQGQIDALKRNGMEFLEIRNLDGKNVTELTTAEARALARILEDNGLKVWSIGSPIGKIKIGDDFASHMDLYRHTLDLAGEFGAGNIRLFSFFMPKDKAPEEFRSQVIDRMAAFVEAAGEYGVNACHENEKGIYGEMAAECRELLDAFYGDHFKAIFDFANFVQAKQDTLEAYELLKDYIAYIHVKDAMWENGSVVPAGMGDGNVAVILKDLYAKGFEGFLSLEPHLFNFSGFAGLERDKDAIAGGETKVLSGAEAFALAHESLVKILGEM